MGASSRNGHRDAHGCCLASGFRPWVVRDRHEHRDWRFRLEVTLQHAALKYLAQRIGRYEAKTPQSRTLARQQFGRPVPPIHHEIGASVHVGMGRPKRLGVTLAESTANVLAAYKRRVANDEISFRGPFRPFRISVAPDFDATALAVGAFERLAALIARQFHGVPSQYGVLLLDGLEVAKDGLRRDAAARAKMPLQKADPEHELGNRGGARIDLDPQELSRVDGAQSFEPPLRR